MNRLHVRHILSLTAILFSIGFVLAFFSQHVLADEPIFLTVGNTPPSLTRTPTKTTEETSGTIAIEAVAVDQNSDDYYLLVCDSDELTQKPNGSYMCGAKAACISPTVHSGDKAECIIPTGNQLISENDGLYLFSCDTGSQPLCSPPWTTHTATTIQQEGFDPTEASVLGTHTSSPTSLVQNDGSGSSLHSTYAAIAAVCIAGLLSTAIIVKTFGAADSTKRNSVLLANTLVCMCALLTVVFITQPHTSPQIPTTPTVLGIAETQEKISETAIADTTVGGLYKVYESPSPDSPVIFYATAGETFPIVHSQNGWFTVLLPDAAEGWIPAASSVNHPYKAQ